MSLTSGSNEEVFVTTLQKKQLLKNQAELKQKFFLSENPLAIIQPSLSWIPINLKDIWNNRELVYTLTMLGLLPWTFFQRRQYWNEF